MAADKIATRLYLDQSIEADTTIGLDHDRAHFLRSVLRLKPGAFVSTFNERDGEWLARIDAIGKGWCSLAVVRNIRLPNAHSRADVWLVFAPIKRARLDFLIEKATELGCSRFLPIFTQFTSVERVNLERLRANARESVEQCERLSVPAVDEPQTLEKLLAGWPSERRLLYCAEAGAARPIVEALAECESNRPWAILVGPEGGFAPPERRRLAHLPFAEAVSLGPRILRSDTAALAALACWQSHLGDWGERPPGRKEV